MYNCFTSIKPHLWICTDMAYLWFIRDALKNFLVVWMRFQNVPSNTLCSKKSDAKIQITITMAHLIRINYPLIVIVISILVSLFWNTVLLCEK